MRNSKSVRYCTFLCGMVISCPAPPHGFCPICTNNSSPYPPVPNAFGGSFGGKIRLAFKKSILSGAHLSAQLWFYCEHKFLEVHARARPCDISNKFYFPVSSCMPCPFQPAFAAVSLPACTIAITARIAARNASVWALSSLIGTMPAPSLWRLKSPVLWGFFIPWQGLPVLDFPVPVNPAQLNN